MSNEELKKVIVTALRKCRHEDAPIPLINEHDLYHVSHMVAVEVRALMVEAWDFGYSCGLGDYGKDPATETTAANPYEDQS